VALTEVLDQGDLGWLPAQQLPGPLTGDGIVKRHKRGEIREVPARITGCDAHGRHAELPGDDAGDLQEQHTVLRDGMEP
jgi:hypothetical protein